HSGKLRFEMRLKTQSRIGLRRQNGSRRVCNNCSEEQYPKEDLKLDKPGRFHDLLFALFLVPAQRFRQTEARRESNAVYRRTNCSFETPAPESPNRPMKFGLTASRIRTGFAVFKSSRDQLVDDLAAELAELLEAAGVVVGKLVVIEPQEVQ
ncbi:MAG: hypothetical protein ACI8QF_004629, partial [Limisphaerales bacterium]